MSNRITYSIGSGHKMAFGFSADIRSQSILTRLLAMLPYVKLVLRK